MEEIRRTISMIERTLQNAPQVILGHVYDRIGFNAIEDDILRHLAIARVCQPMSKVATVEYLKSYFDEDVQLHNIYRYMDRLYNTQQEKIQKISVSHKLDVLGRLWLDERDQRESAGIGRIQVYTWCPYTERIP